MFCFVLFCHVFNDIFNESCFFVDSHIRSCNICHKNVKCIFPLCTEALNSEFIFFYIVKMIVLINNCIAISKYEINRLIAKVSNIFSKDCILTIRLQTCPLRNDQKWLFTLLWMDCTFFGKSWKHSIAFKKIKTDTKFWTHKFIGRSEGFTFFNGT